MTKKKLKVNTDIRINVYRILSDEVDTAVRYGYNRSHKYTEQPDSDAIIEAIQNSVMSALCDLLIFPDNYED